MTQLGTKTVGALAAEIPGATRVFEKLGIDYCCGGGRSLDSACSEAGLSIDEVGRSLEQVQQAPPSPNGERAWHQTKLSELIEHIISTHHVFTREELARINPLLDKVCSVHGQNHPELLSIQKSFRGLTQELSLHMQKEEQVLFPFILRLEQEVLAQRTAPTPPFGSLQNPIRVMVMEHDAAGGALEAMRQASSNYAAPSDACTSFRSLYQALPALEADLHQHIHLENNLLFPRAINLECGV
jgi:regulator of cell morphogenesis and NO signaling